MPLNRQPRDQQLQERKKLHNVTTSTSSCKTDDMVNDRVLYTLKKIQKATYDRNFFFYSLIIFRHNALSGVEKIGDCCGLAIGHLFACQSGKLVILLSMII
jgi:hypothetical protein